MSFKLPDWWEKKKQEEYELKYISYNGEQIHVSELEDKSVTPEMNKNMRMNSYAQEDLPPKLTDETLIEKAKYYKTQCSHPRFPCATYDEALIHNILPEMIKRLGDSQKEVEGLRMIIEAERGFINSQNIKLKREI